MNHALCLPPTGQLADPSVYAELARTAEAGGWDGLFLWDHVLRAPSEPGAIADPWICLAAAATGSRRLRLGPMVTPVTRRRPIKLAKEVVGIDQLSGGRVTLGLGLGVDSYGELSGLGEIVDARTRGDRLDEGVELLRRFWSGERVEHDGEHFVAHGITVLPVPVQRPHPPLWFAARGDARRPVRRAAHHQGLVPVDVDAEQLRRMVELVAQVRGHLDGFDVACRPRAADEYAAMAEIGATWMITDHWPPVTLDEVMVDAAAGPDAFFARG